MARVTTTSAILIVFVLCGCGTTTVSPMPVVVNSAVVGKWAVTAVDGKPLPSGAEITVVYEIDGQVKVEATGDTSGVPSLDRGELKLAMDRVAAPQATLLHKLEVTAGTTRVELKWNGGDREAPVKPVPPKK